MCLSLKQAIYHEITKAISAFARLSAVLCCHCGWGQGIKKCLPHSHSVREICGIQTAYAILPLCFVYFFINRLGYKPVRRWTRPACRRGSPM